MERWIQDLAFSMRTLRRRPLFTAVAVLTLGVGIGSATAMFSVVDGVLLSKMPFVHADALLAANIRVDHPGYLKLAEEARSLEAVAIHQAFAAMGMTVSAPDRRPQIAQVAVGSASLLATLGVQPALGRWFTDDEEGRTEGTGARVVVIGDQFWRSVLGGDPSVLGSSIVLDNEPHVVIGVLPADFTLRFFSNGPGDSGKRDIWLPVGHPKTGLGQGAFDWEILARLRPSQSLGSASEEFRTIVLGPDYSPDDNNVAFMPREARETRGLASPLLILFGATGLLLLIACGNVATLCLGEAQGRVAEIGTRAALGATRLHIVRQLLTESLVIGAAGGLLGAAIAFVGTKVLVSAAPPIPRISSISVDLKVLAFATALGVIAAFLFGTVPAVSMSRRAKGGAVRDVVGGGRTGRRRFERFVVVGQVSITAVLLVLGGLLTRSLDQLFAVDLGFDPASVATMKVTLPQADYFSEDFYSHGNEPLETFYRQAIGEISAIPGVRSVSASTNLPMQQGVIGGGTVKIDGRDGDAEFAATRVHVLPGYFETLSVPLVRGRTLSDQDGASAPLAMVISESLAREYWPEGDAIGAQVTYWRGTFTVVGVVGNIARASMGAPPEHVFYVPLVQTPRLWGHFVARVEGDPSSAIGAMRDAIWAVAPGVAISEESSMEGLRERSAATERFRTVLMSTFAALAAILAAVGIFGSTGRAVAQRRRELGVRIAMGAEVRTLVLSEVGGGLLLGALGIAVGLIASTWVARLIGGFLFGVDVTDVATYCTVAVLLAAVSVVASYWPARRISGVDPASVLRGG